MLTNVLPKLVNLKNIYLSAPSESIVPVLRILQTTGTRLHGLSLQYVLPVPCAVSYLTIPAVPQTPLLISPSSNYEISPTSPTPLLEELSLVSHPSSHSLALRYHLCPLRIPHMLRRRLTGPSPFLMSPSATSPRSTSPVTSPKTTALESWAISFEMGGSSKV